MDWTETVAPIAMFDAIWPNHRNNAVRKKFNAMHRLLRMIVLHYVRGDSARVGIDASMDAREWALTYAEEAERVRPPLTHTIHPFAYNNHAHACVTIPIDALL